MSRVCGESSDVLAVADGTVSACSGVGWIDPQRIARQRSESEAGDASDNRNATISSPLRTSRRSPTRTG